MLSMTAGTLSSDGTTMAVLPLSNSIGFQPARTKNTYEPFACIAHHGNTRWCFSTMVRSPSFLTQLRTVRL
jgi:hypothetical protein